MKALIVDTQRERRRQLRLALDSLGWKIDVLEAASGEEAWLIFARQTVDLLVTSVRLAGFSGVELAQRAQKRRSTIKVILIAGNADGRLTEQASAAGADGLLAWPVLDEEFLAAVRRSLQSGDTAALQQPFDPADDGRSGKDTQIKDLVKARPPGEFTLTERLEAARAELDAQACLLVDSGGQVMARAGKLPRSLEVEPFAKSAAAAAASASGLASALPDAAQPGVLWTPFDKFEIYLAGGESPPWLAVFYPALAAPGAARPLGRIQAAAIGFSGKTPSARLQPKRDAQPLPSDPAPRLPPEKASSPPARPAGQARVADPAPAGTASPAPPGPNDPELEKLFARGVRKRIKTQELNEFWDTLAEETNGEKTEMDGGKAITYDEARRMGLAPGEAHPGDE
jgi:CheY-like chemotaxis protein